MMGIKMIGLIIGLLTYMVFADTGFFGGDIIYALDVMENWYWIIFFIFAIIAAIVFFGTTFAGAISGDEITKSKSGILGGTVVGALFGGFMSLILMLRVSLQLLIIYWLMGSIEPTAANFDAITTKETIGLVTLIILAIIPFSKSSSD